MEDHQKTHELWKQHPEHERSSEDDVKSKTTRSKLSRMSEKSLVTDIFQIEIKASESLFNIEEKDTLYSEARDNLYS